MRWCKVTLFGPLLLFGLFLNTCTYSEVAPEPPFHRDTLHILSLLHILLRMSSCFQPLFKKIGEMLAVQKGGVSATFSSMFKDPASGLILVLSSLRAAWLCRLNLKGTVSQDFFCFFMNHLPQTPENNIGVITNFSKIHGDIHMSRCTAGINDTSGNLPRVSMTPAVNLPPVSTTPVTNSGNNIRLLTP
jgi:hypothetical protein